jgi:hypothetical protein
MPMKRMKCWMAGALLAAVAACGPAPEPGSVSRGGSRVIVEAEILQTAAPNVLDLVQRLRPGWIQQRPGAGGRGYPVVYLGPQRYGEIARLREIDTSNVLEVRYLNGPEAASRFGRGVEFGVIQVILDIGG